MGVIDAVKSGVAALERRAAANAAAQAGPARPAGVDTGDDLGAMGRRLAAECTRLGVSARHVTDAQNGHGWTRSAQEARLSEIEDTLATIDMAHSMLVAMPQDVRARAAKLRKDLGLTSGSTPYDAWTSSAGAYLTRVKATADAQLT